MSVFKTILERVFAVEKIPSNESFENDITDVKNTTVQEKE